MQHGGAEGKAERKGRAEEVAASDKLRFSPQQHQVATGPDPAPPPAALGRACAWAAPAGETQLFSGKKGSGHTALAGARTVGYYRDRAQLTALAPVTPITDAS